MARSYKSRKRDTPQGLSDSLRDARLKRGLSQAQLAGKLALRQRQISDLERAAMDPRLSTIENVARALNLELMLVPRHLITAVERLQRSSTDASGGRPMYGLGDADEPLDPGDESHVEVGGATGRQHRRPKDRR
jgi:transcriptional regulator with XRE-family HTH domain